MDGKNYSAVPPPASLNGSNGASSAAAPLDFNDALSKARAIAEKLKQQTGGKSETPSSDYSAPPTASSGSKRGYNDDDRDDYHSTTSSRSSYGGYGNDSRDNKRSAYDSGSSRPSYGGNESRRYGLGSEERKPYQYGGNQEEYSVPNHMVGLLIGKGGENLKKIERMSGVSKVQFANDPVGNERVVHLHGEPDQIAIARDMIRQMVSDAQANERPGRNEFQQGGGNTLTIRIPMNKVGLVIGRGGETIRDFEERSKAKILILQDSAGDSNNERTINLVGDDNATQLAKSLIEDIVYGNNNNSGYGQQQQQYQGYGGGGGYGQQPGGYGGYGRGRHDEERVFITVPASAVGLIIGRGGETVRSMQDQSGARVKIDPSNDPNSEERTVNISGDPQCVAIAKQLVEDKVAEASSGRGGRHDRHNNDRGGYRSRHDYGNDYSQQGGEGGYDYNQQYGQYYQQYGYDQSQYNSAGNNSGSYQQYPGYQYNYQQGGYGNDKAPSGGDSGAEGAPAASSTADSSSKEGGDKAEGGDGSNASAYYAQYYGGQQPTKEQQEAYYQWYQQYYGGQQQQQQQQQQPQYDQQNQGNVDGEPLEEKEGADKESDATKDQ